MNKYNLFFQTSIHAHFVALLLELYRLYQTRNDTCNIPGLIKEIRGQHAFSNEILEEIEGLYKDEAKPLWVKVNILRNKAFGHRSNAHTVKEGFEEAEIKTDELHDLVEVAKKLMDRIASEWGRSAHAFNLGSRESLINLLEDIKKLHQC